ncbi:MAG: hypothetical protein JNK72_19215 [Myxococcales bacterium]|nr:hypothetical protein [Myxococcales bacterium]
MKPAVTALALAATLALPTLGWAQQATPPRPVTSDTAPVPRSTEPDFPRFGRHIEHSFGLRGWAWNTPAWIVGLFAHVENDWSGPMTFAPALEYVYRKGNLDLVVGLQYTSLSTGVGYIRGQNEGDTALERIESRLWTISANALFLWTTRITDWVEFQIGMGAGISYVGGNLYHTQVARTSGGGFVECTGPTMPNFEYCGNPANGRYLNADGTRYTEPRLGSGGSVPPVIPWLSIPHAAFHFRPHRHVDLRVDGGYGVIGFYGGLAAHYVY